MIPILIGLNIIIAAILIVLLLRRSPDNIIKLDADIQNLKGILEKTERDIREEFSKSREEIGRQLKAFNDSSISGMVNISKLQENKLENMRDTIETRIKHLQDENSQKLEEMRITVDEKLHATLEKRLSESFKLVSERLEQVYKGLGEMQTLAVGVGDLKKVLSNVKTRGVLGEIQLSNLLEQVLIKEQYDTNVATKDGSSDRVEFAIKLPGRDDSGSVVWLPIDAKFPLETYQRLLEAEDTGELELVRTLEQSLEANIKTQAKKIQEKYIDPPNTTDFAVMFLPIEGLYAEILRRPGLCEILQRKYRVIPTGPTTITALLNSLQMGFRTLAVEKRAGEVWRVLGIIKTEFGKFGDILDKTYKKIQEASNTIEDAAKKSRTIERKLNKVQELPSPRPTENGIEYIEAE